MPRRDISMSDAEVDEFLSQRSRMVVGAIDADGWPIGSIAGSGYREGSFSLDLPTGDPVLDAVDHDGRICCVDDDHATYYDIRGVIVHATATRVDGSDRVLATVDRVVSFDFGRLR